MRRDCRQLHWRCALVQGEQAVSGYCAFCGEPLRPDNVGGYCGQHRYRKFAARDNQIATLARKGWMAKEIAAELGVKKGVVWGVLRKRGIRLRNVTVHHEYAQRAVEVASRWAGANPDQLRLDWRFPRELIHARWAVMHVMHERAWSTPKIGELINRDHSTVIYGLQKARELRQREPKFAALVEELQRA